MVRLDAQIFGGVQAIDFGRQVSEFCENGGRCLVVDLGEVRLMNSSGLGMLVSAMTAMRKYGGSMRLARLPEKVSELLEMTRLDTIFDVYQSVEEARKACA